MQVEPLLGRIVNLLEETPGQAVIELAANLNVNRTFLAGYLRALEEQGHVKSRRVGPARVYYNKERLPT